VDTKLITWQGNRTDELQTELDYACP